MHDKKKRSFLIVADGEFISTPTLVKRAQNKVVVALDRASERLLDIGILPDIVIGDFDSIQDKQRWGIDLTKLNTEQEFTAQISMKTVQMVYRPDQHETDFFKAIRYIDTLNPIDIHIVCALSSRRLDHLLNNIRALRVFYQKMRPIYFYTVVQKAFYVKNDTIHIDGKIGDTFGILGFPSACFSSKGLKYNGKKFPLTFGFSESVANQLVSQKAIIDIEGEALFIQEDQG